MVVRRAPPRSPGQKVHSELNIRGLPVVPLRDTTSARRPPGPETRPAAGEPPSRQEATTMTIRSSIRSILAPTAGKAVAVVATGAVAAALGLTASAGAATGAAATGGAHARTAATSFSFKLVPSSAAISACLPHAGGHATIIPKALNDVMKVTLTGMPRNVGFDL